MRSKYVGQIVRRLQCSGARRKEIQKQLTADIEAELENGAKEEAIIAQMGTPDEIAKEFNSSFTDAERRKYRREKWVKRLAAVAVLLFLLASALYWAFPKQTPVEESQVFREEEVKEQAEKVVGLLNAGDYSALLDMANEALKPALDAGSLEQAKSNLGSDWGEFQSFGNCYMAEVEQQGSSFAVAQLGAAYKNISVTYTISFDEDMKLAGLYMK